MHKIRREEGILLPNPKEDTDMAIRRNSKVRYIGDRYDYAKGQVFRVLKKSYGGIFLYFPTKYLDGSIHRQEVYMSIEDFEEVK